MHKLIGEDRKVVSVKTIMDKKEYLANGYYREFKNDVPEEDKKEGKQEQEVKVLDSESAVELAQALVSGEKEEKSLEDMNKEERRLSESTPSYHLNE